MCQEIMLDRASWSKSLLPNYDMIHKFMCKKSYFSTHGRAILFTCTTILISLDQTFDLLSKFNSKSIFIGCHFFKLFPPP
jgi:hypothetical protein